MGQLYKMLSKKGAMSLKLRRFFILKIRKRKKMLFV